MGDSGTEHDGEDDTSSENIDDSSDATGAKGRAVDPDLVRRTADLGRQSSAVWLAMAKRWTVRAKADSQWKPEDVVVDSTDLFEQFTPILKESFEVWIDFLRPWAVQIEQGRVTGADDE